MVRGGQFKWHTKSTVAPKLLAKVPQNCASVRGLVCHFFWPPRTWPRIREYMTVTKFTKYGTSTELFLPIFTPSKRRYGSRLSRIVLVGHNTGWPRTPVKKGLLINGETNAKFGSTNIKKAGLG
jgi:hypothetical protein